jgi:predicted RNase H-like nuclease (RuvC/YqgF family)
MKRQLIFTLLLFSSLSVFAQSISGVDLDKELKALPEKFKKLQTENSLLKSKIGFLNSKLSSINARIDSLRHQSLRNDSAINKTANELGIKIQETGSKNEGNITKVSESLSKNSLYGIIGVLSTILLSGLLYWLLSKRQQTDKTDFIDQLSKTKSSIEESLVKEFGKQTELMDSQLHLIEQQKTTLQATPNAEPDHSLALKVASEINLIERNINLMDSKTKGLKQLQNSVGKLKDNLSANGYEMPELLGKPFNQGMRVIVATSITDENLEKGAELITKILIPQVNYNDKMIQTAQIEVSVGY